MRKFIFMMVSVIIACASLLSAPAATAAPTRPSKSSVAALIPTQLVVEQTATLSNGRNITVYYKKSGNIVEVYSNDDLKGYNVADLVTLKSTSFRVVTRTEGRLVYKTTVAKASALVKRLVNTYL